MQGSTCISSSHGRSWADCFVSEAHIQAFCEASGSTGSSSSCLGSEQTGPADPLEQMQGISSNGLLVQEQGLLVTGGNEVFESAQQLQQLSRLFFDFFLLTSSSGQPHGASSTDLLARGQDLLWVGGNEVSESAQQLQQLNILFLELLLLATSAVELFDPDSHSQNLSPFQITLVPRPGSSTTPRQGQTLSVILVKGGPVRFVAPSLARCVDVHRQVTSAITDCDLDEVRMEFCNDLRFLLLPELPEKAPDFLFFAAPQTGPAEALCGAFSLQMQKSVSCGFIDVQITELAIWLGPPFWMLQLQPLRSEFSAESYTEVALSSQLQLQLQPDPKMVLSPAPSLLSLGSVQPQTPWVSSYWDSDVLQPSAFSSSVLSEH